MDSPLPRRARFVRLPDPTGTPRVALVLRDSQDPAPQGRCSFKLRSHLFPVPQDNVTIAILVVMLQLRAEKEQRLYAAWIDELAPSGAEVLESLALQTELKVWFASPESSGAASVTILNVLRGFAIRHLDTVLELAETSPWDVRGFAAARSIVESRFPDAQTLWEQLKAGG